MSSQLVASIPRSRIQSLACQGIRVVENYHQIKELVRAKLGDDHALLFAEPASLGGSGDSIDWYTPVQGPVRPVTELPEEEAQKIFALVRQMGQGIKRLAQELKDSGNQQQIVRGSILEMALCYPEVSYIYAVGGQPVLTCWGFSAGTAGAQPEDLARCGEGFVTPKPRASSAKPVPTQITDRERGVFFPWLPALLLLLLLLTLLFVPFGNWEPLVSVPGLNFRLPALPGASEGAASQALDELQGEEKQLRADIEKLRLRLEERAALCVPPAPERAEVTPQDLVIPEKSSDYKFLEGSWKSDAGLVSKEDGKPIIVIYSFDANGEGTATVKRGDGDCVGKARAQFTAGGALRIESEKQVCPTGGRSYAEEIIECSPTGGGRASCRGKSASGADWGGFVNFRRIP
ncbi:MAG: hypothetical protein LBS65_10040 [Desulfovibrio sp.]|jgi:hypothetical protein|nr:hypothetical protein [Desulfovibrio sp.]